MTSINELMPSKYLKKENVIPDVLVTISQIITENIAKDNEKPEMKAIVYFKEFNQGLMLNITNKELLILEFGTDQIESWIGKQVTLHNDPSISIAGKLTGGIRIRLTQYQSTTAHMTPTDQREPRTVNPSTAQAYDNNGKPIY